MADKKKWNKLSETSPPLDTELDFLWNQTCMKGKIESGYAIKRKLDDSIHLRYPFIGSIEPTHWSIHEVESMSLPEPESEL